MNVSAAVEEVQVSRLGDERQRAAMNAALAKAAKATEDAERGREEALRLRHRPVAAAPNVLDEAHRKDVNARREALNDTTRRAGVFVWLSCDSMFQRSSQYHLCSLWVFQDIPQSFLLFRK